MANINLVTANRAEIVVPSQILPPLVAGEAITAGAAIRLNTTTGRAVNAAADDALGARVIGIATRTVAAGEPITGVKLGVMDGFDLSGLDYDQDVFLSDDSGRLADAAGTVETVVGRVIPGNATTVGTAPDKLLLLEIGHVGPVGPQGEPGGGG